MLPFSEKELKDRLHVLIIDHDEAGQEAIQHSLNNTVLQTQICTVDSATKGLAQLKEQEFDCIFIDFKLPDMNGLYLLNQIKEMQVTAPVLVVTSHGDERIAAQAIRQGAADYIPKSLLTPEGVYRSILTGIRLQKAELHRRQAEERLQVTQNQFEFVVSNSPIAFWSITKDGVINFACGMGYTLTGIDPKAIIGKSIYQVFAKFPRILERFNRALQGEEVQSVDESAGAYFKAQYVPVFDDQHQVTGVTGFAFDVTDSTRNEQELTKAKDLAEQSVRIKEQFIANISHEIRTPMNGIIGLAGLLQKTGLDKAQRKYLQAIQTSADNLMHIINDLLDFSKIAAQKFTIEQIPFDLPELINEVITLLEAKANEQGNSLTPLVAYTPSRKLVGDPYRLKQILLNLIGNAIKFTSNGSIKLHVATIASTEQKEIIEFTVEDTGIGIPEEKLLTIFESFNQGSNDITRKFGGTGLGLTITKSLVELQGGTIAVRSQQNAGSAFTFSLPFVLQEPDPEPATHSLSTQELPALTSTKSTVDLNTLKGMASDNDGLLAEIIALFITNINESLTQIEQLWQLQKTVELRACLTELHEYLSVIDAYPLLSALEEAILLLDDRAHILLEQAIYRIKQLSKDTTATLQKELLKL